MKQLSLRPFIRWMPTFLWIGVIFLLSAQPAPVSAKQSESLLLRILEVSISLSGKTPDQAQLLPIAENFNELFRTLTHIGIFGIFGLLCAVAFLQSRMNRFFFPFTVGFGLLNAILDEVHQLFVPGRSFQILDISADFLGILVASLCILLIKKYKKYKNWQD